MTTEEKAELLHQPSGRSMDVEQLFVALSSLSNSDARKNLKKLQKLLRKRKFKQQFIEKDGISKLASGLSAINGGREQQNLNVTSCSSTEDRRLVVSEVLSCLARLIPGNRICITQFLKAGGVKITGNLLHYCSSDVAIRNICSLIVAIAGEATVSQEIAATLVNSLPRYKDTQLSVTILRTLWTVCLSAESVCAAATACEFPTVVKQLSSDNERIVKASVRVLHRFLKVSAGDKLVALKVLLSDGLQQLLELMQKNLLEDECCMVSDCLYYMIVVPEVRVSENCANFIHFCTNELTRDHKSKRFRNAFLSLCLCAMEAMNRIKMRCTGALEKFVDFLGHSEYSEYHFQIVSTFVCFLFDDPSLVVMLRAGLLPNLLTYLEEIMKLQSEGRLNEVSKILLPNYNPFSSPGHALGPASADGSSPNILGARGPFHDVMLLLSKLSRTAAIRWMVSKSCVNRILKYLSTAEHFDSKAEKILVRITQEPQFFELLLKLGIVQSMFFQLNTCCSIAHLEDVVSQMRSVHAGSGNLLRFGTDVISFKEFSKACIYPFVKDDSSAEYAKQTDQYAKKNMDGSVHSSTNKHDRQRCAKSLMSNLSRHAESPFGQGVLTHALLSDVNEIKETFIIGYCYLCRSKQFQKHIFIELKGLELILNLILKSEDDDKKLCDGLLALSGLAKSTGLNRKKKPRRSALDWDYTGVVMRILTLDEDLQRGSDSKRRRISDSEQQSDKTAQCCIFSTLFCNKTPSTPTGSSCNLKKTTRPQTENPKDVINNVCFCLEESVTISVYKDAILSASPVFAAMLSESFVDSSLPFVSLKDILAASFILLLHHMLGCAIDLESFSCVGGCKFDGAVEVSCKGNGPESSIESNPHVSEAGACFTKYKRFDCVNGEENSDELSVRGCQRSSKEEGAKNCHGDAGQVGESNCNTKHMSKEHRLCLVTDLMRISDRFLLDELRKECEEYLAEQLSAETAALFYIEALSCQARFLSASCVRYILADMEDPVAYLKTAVTLYTSTEKLRFLEDVKSILEAHIDSK